MNLVTGLVPFPLLIWVSPLGDPHKLVGVSNSIEDRFRKRLTSRKRQYISKGGRLKLIRSTLSSLPIYFLYLFQMPNSVCSKLENIQRDFIWGNENLDQKPHLINLKTMCSEKKKGGLRVRNLSKINQSLLCKWNWRFANYKEPLWRNVISVKFGEMVEGWTIGDIKGGFDTV